MALYGTVPPAMKTWGWGMSPSGEEGHRLVDKSMAGWWFGTFLLFSISYTLW